MKETNYWQQFMSTGSIKDYLDYRTNCNQGENSSVADVNAGTGVFGQRKISTGTIKDLGVNSYAGVCSSNRNDFKDGACR